MLAPNTIVAGRYRVVKPLGGGGMKLVYLAEDQRLASRRCALAEMIDSFTNADMQQQAANAFRREAEMLAQLNNEHIPRIYDYFSYQNRHYLVMEFIDGLTLEQELKGAGGKLDARRVIDVALQVLETLIYLHGLEPSVIYRDLKPSNIMITADGRAKLIDFGIARHFQPLSNATMIGTQGYAPPEQYRGKVELRSDLYALGATMHHCLSGRDPASEPPFSFPPLRKLCPSVDPALAALVDKALAYDIEQRIPSAQEFYRSLLEIKRAADGNLSASSNAAPSPLRSAPQMRLPLGSPAAAAPATPPAQAPTIVLGTDEILCPKCRRPIPADSRFCSFCAADLMHLTGGNRQTAEPDTKTELIRDSSGIAEGQRGFQTLPANRLQRLIVPVIALMALLMAGFITLRIYAYFAQPSPDYNGADAGPGALVQPQLTMRLAALRQALNSEGYSNVHFRMSGDTIVLWGTVPTLADRLMVQTTVYTVGNIFSIEDHIKTQESFAGP
jgi:serine/threonine protein kinase